MDFIDEIKIKECDWHKFIKYISLDRTDLFIQIGISIILFDLDNEKTTFEDIVETVKSYYEEFVENEEIYDVCMWRMQLSSVDPIFFQEYAQGNYGVSLDDYQEQANYGAVFYCENFIKYLYDNMEKYRLSETV